MPVTLVTTPGSADANAYATIAETDAEAALQWPADTTWDNATDEEQKIVTVQATRLLDQLRFAGDRADGTQALEWPRAGVPTPGYYALYETTEIPEPVTRAQSLLAIWLIGQTADVAESSDLGGLTALDLGDELSMRFEGSTSESASQSGSALSRFLAATIRPVLGGLAYAEQARVVRG